MVKHVTICSACFAIRYGLPPTLKDPKSPARTEGWRYHLDLKRKEIECDDCHRNFRYLWLREEF